MPKKKKKQRFNKAEDDCGESNQNQNLGDEIKTLKKDNLIQVSSYYVDKNPSSKLSKPHNME